MLLPESLPQLPPTSRAVKEWLADVDNLRIPVTTEFYHQCSFNGSRLKDVLVPTDGSVLPAKLTSLLASAPVEHHSEMTATLAIGMFFDTLFPAFNSYSKTGLGCTTYLNKTNTGTSSTVTKRRTRPDTFLVASSCTLLGTLPGLDGCTYGRYFNPGCGASIGLCMHLP